MPRSLDSDFDYSPAAIVRFFDEFGYMPFTISGGSGEGDDDGDLADDEPDDDDTGGKAKGDKGGDDPTEVLNKALADERKARRTAEKSIKDLQKQINDLKNTGKPETEQLQSKLKQTEDERTDALNRLQESSGKSAIVEAAVKAGSSKPDLVYRLVKENLEFDSEYEVTNVAALLAEAKKDAPELFKAPTGKGDGGSRDEGGRKKTGNGMNSWIRQQAGVSD